ncbi:MAG TPA: hypothetical protein ENI85_11995 [Deltaproteobacteria bacterium]|nr:hypothetical protein [Deltaproteobacteria bacterium]
MSELVPVAILFGAIFLQLVVVGFLNARLQLRHPSEKLRLGEPIDFRPLNRDTIPHGIRWLRFVVFENFRLRDPYLSILCITVLILNLGILGYLAGFLRIPVAAA